MPQISSRNGRTGHALTFRVERSLVIDVLRVLNVNLADAGEERPVARVSSRHHAIEHVDAGRDRVHQILRRAHSHQIPRLVRGQERRGEVDDVEHLLLRLPNGDAAEGDAVEVDRGDLLDASLAQIFIDAALNDSKEGHRPAASVQRSPGPAMRHLHRLFHVSVRQAIRRALVKRHGDVDAHPRLDVDRRLRRQEVQ